MAEAMRRSMSVREPIRARSQTVPSRTTSSAPSSEVAAVGCHTEEVGGLGSSRAGSE